MKTQVFSTRYGAILVPWDAKMAYIQGKVSWIQYILFKMLNPDIIIIDIDKSLILPSYILWDPDCSAEEAIENHNNRIIQSYSKTIYPDTAIHLNNQWIGYTSEKCTVFPISEYSHTIVHGTSTIGSEFTSGTLCSFNKGRYIWICIMEYGSHGQAYCKISTNIHDRRRVYVETPLQITGNNINDIYVNIMPYMITSQAFPYAFENYKDITIMHNV